MLVNLASKPNAPNLRELWIEGNDIVVEMNVSGAEARKFVNISANERNVRSARAPVT